MSNWTDRRQYDHSRYQQRVNAGRCGQCGQKHKPDGYKTCADCRAVQAAYNRKWRAGGGKTQKQGPGIESLKDRTPGCIRCGLRGEHICLKGQAAERRPWL